MRPCPPRLRTAARRLVAVAAVLGVGAVLGGCGSSGEEDPLQRAMAEQFSVVADLGSDDAYCYAGELLGYFGTEEMQRFVDNPGEFQPSTPADQAVLLDALRRCGIDPAALQPGGESATELELEPVEDPPTSAGDPSPSGGVPTTPEGNPEPATTRPA